MKGIRTTTTKDTKNTKEKDLFGPLPLPLSLFVSFVPFVVFLVRLLIWVQSLAN